MFASFGSIGGKGSLQQALPDPPDPGEFDWNPGVPGGIPEYTVQYNVVDDYSADPLGVANSTTAFNNAIAATTAGRALYVPAGTYLVTDELSIDEGIAIRGAGIASTTILSQHGGTTLHVQSDAPSQVTTLSDGALKYAQTITVVSAVSLSTGDFVELTDTGNIQQIVEIDSIDGSVVTLVGVLHADFASGSAVELHDMIEGVGFEDIKIHVDWAAFSGGGGVSVLLERVARCWVKNVEFTGYCFRCVNVTSSFQCEVRDSYGHQDLIEAASKDSFDAYGLEMAEATTDSLVENNVMTNYRHAYVSQGDNAGGNVFGYNFHRYMVDNDGNRSWGLGDMEFHHDRVEHILVEGISVEECRFANDNLTDLNKENNYVLRSRFKQSGMEARGGNYAIGNEFPSQGVTGTGTLNNMRNNPPVGDVPTVEHGNYVVYDVGDELVWDDDYDPTHTIPDSYYLSERPDWFGDLAWPPFGGDLTDAAAGNVNLNRNPAEVRFWSIQFPEETPTVLTATVDGSDVDLAWTNNSAPEDVDFVICRSDDGVSFERVGVTGLNDITYTDVGGSAGQYYYIRARNYLGGEDGDEMGGESDHSNEVVAS